LSYDDSATKRRHDKEVGSVVDVKMSTIAKDIDDLKKLPIKILIVFISVFGTAMSTIAYSMINDHIELKNIKNTIETDKRSPSRNIVPFTRLKTTFVIFKKQTEDRLERLERKGIQ